MQNGYVRVRKRRCHVTQRQNTGTDDPGGSGGVWAAAIAGTAVIGKYPVGTVFTGALNAVHFLLEG
eukprot:6257884-Pyramimonas_sp.AAC.1